MNILFIDDHPEFIHEIAAQLEDCGHNVKCCLRADDAVKEIEYIANYSVVILDIMMRLGSIIRSDEAPETGIAIYKRLRKVQKAIPILVISALSKDRFWKQNGFAGDAHVTYVAKPLGAEEQIQELVERAMP